MMTPHVNTVIRTVKEKQDLYQIYTDTVSVSLLGVWLRFFDVCALAPRVLVLLL